MHWTAKKNLKGLVDYPQVISLASGSINIGEAILVHDPIGFFAGGGFSGVEHEGFLDSERFGFSDGLVGSGGFPVPTSGGSVWSRSVWVFSVPRRKKVPFFLTV